MVGWLVGYHRKATWHFQEPNTITSEFHKILYQLSKQDLMNIEFEYEFEWK